MSTKPTVSLPLGPSPEHEPEHAIIASGNRPAGTTATDDPAEEAGLRAMYRRLAQAAQQHPTTSDQRAEVEAGADEEAGLRAMYRRLAAAYEAEPTVPDRGGGVVGDRFPW